MPIWQLSISKFWCLCQFDITKNLACNIKEILQRAGCQIMTICLKSTIELSNFRHKCCTRQSTYLVKSCLIFGFTHIIRFRMEWEVAKWFTRPVTTEGLPLSTTLSIIPLFIEILLISPLSSYNRLFISLFLTRGYRIKLLIFKKN